MGKTYYEVMINASSSGFEMYEANLADTGENWDDKINLLNEIRGNVGEIYNLDSDELPEGLEDIKGRIYNEPDEVYGWLDSNGVAHYFGINQTK